MGRQELRQIQLDVDTPAFSREAHRQSLAVAASDYDADDQAFIDAVTDWGDA